MIEGLYKSEEKVYFRDQEYFHHYLLLDGKGGVYNLTGKYSNDEAIKIMTRSTKSIKGSVKKSLFKTTVVIKQADDEITLLIKKRNGFLEVRNLASKDYEERSGKYEYVAKT